LDAVVEGVDPVWSTSPISCVPKWLPIVAEALVEVVGAVGVVEVVGAVVVEVVEVVDEVVVEVVVVVKGLTSAASGNFSAWLEGGGSAATNFV
jgi:hypothetical protein